MKKILISIVAGLIVFSCNTQQTQVEEPDFNGSYWGDSPEQVKDVIGLGEPKEYPDGVILQLEWEGQFLGVQSKLDEGIVARMAYFFENQELKGAWYYIMALKEQFNGEGYVAKFKKQWGEPVKVWTEPEMNKEYYLWKTDKTAVKVMVRDAGDKVRFEWYNYEIGWFEEHKGKLINN